MPAPLPTTADVWLASKAAALLGVPASAEQLLEEGASRASIARFCAGGSATLLVYGLKLPDLQQPAEQSAITAETQSADVAASQLETDRTAPCYPAASSSTREPPSAHNSGKSQVEGGIQAPAGAGLADIAVEPSNGGQLADNPASTHAEPIHEVQHAASDAGERRLSMVETAMQGRGVCLVELRATAAMVPAGQLACPTVYFLRREPQHQALQAKSIESQLICGLLPVGPSVSSLHQLLTAVVVPCVALQQGAVRHTGTGSCDSLAAGSTLYQQLKLSELLAAAHKFARQVEQVAKQLGAEVELALPQGVDLSAPVVAAAREEAVLACERCLVEWARVVSTTMQHEGQIMPQGRGPLAELHHWQRRAAVYSSLHDQLLLPAVQATVEVVARGSMDRGLLPSFQATASELARLALEAADNVKFLLTLERHFSTIASGSMQAVADALGPMMNALRMIWIISRFFGDDLRMSNLLERIGHGLEDRLCTAVDVTALFAMPAAEALRLVATCKAIAEGWQGSYMRERARIEASGHHARWEFSRGLLFDATNHAAGVCDELLGMLSAVGDFRQSLGPELKAVTGDTGVVDEVNIMVQAMVEPVMGVSFNVLDRAHIVDWRAIVSRFQRDAEDIKLATRDLIDTCFRRLRTSEAAVNLLHSFKRIRVGGSIQEQMRNKLTDVLEQFLKEIVTTAKVFEEAKPAPPISRSMPPVAGAIKWSRGLFARIKRTMTLLQELDGSDLAGLDAGRRVSKAYLDLARLLLDYEKGCFATWCSSEASITPLLHQPILQLRRVTSCASISGVDQADTHSQGPAAAKQSSLQVNFAPQLLQLIREAKYLDRLGFAVPELAVNMAMQQGHFRQQIERLTVLLEMRRQAVAPLSSAERILLSDHIATLDAAMRPGLERLNWVSLAVPEFVDSVTKEIEHFQALSAHIKSHSAMIEKAVHFISRAQLIPWSSLSIQHGTISSSQSTAAMAPAAPGEELQATGHMAVPGLQEFYEECEHARLGVVEGLVVKYRSISDLLLKVEEAVLGSSTGKAPKLAPYIAYWERRVYGAIHTLVLAGMDALQERLQACTVPSPNAMPLLRVSLELLRPEVVVTPSMSEVAKQMSRLMRSIVDSSKAFVRWQDGTCIETPEQFIYGEDNEPFVFSFLSDTSTSPAIIRSMLAANHLVQKVSAAVTRHMEGWKQYSVVWRADRAGLLSRLAAKCLPPEALEDKMAKYVRLAADIYSVPTTADIGFVRVCSMPLADAIRQEAEEWVTGFATVARAADGAVLNALEERVLAMRSNAGPKDAWGNARTAPGQQEPDHAKEAAIAVQTTATELGRALLALHERVHARSAYVGSTPEHTAQAEALASLQRTWQELQGWAQEHTAENTDPPRAPVIENGLPAEMNDNPPQDADTQSAIGHESAASGGRMSDGVTPATAAVAPVLSRSHTGAANVLKRQSTAVGNTQSRPTPASSRSSQSRSRPNTAARLSSAPGSKAPKKG